MIHTAKQQTSTKTCYFQISGNFITDLVRTWFWDEHRPLNTCIDIIANCMCDAPEEQVKETAIAILEGRKQFTGINEFELVPDGQNIRSMADYIQMQEKEATIQKIQLDMLSSFRKYVDVWATIKSSNVTAFAGRDEPLTYQECEDWYAMETPLAGNPHPLLVNGEPLIETPTMAGLWLIREPELVYACCKGDMSRIGKPDFWQNIYEAVKDHPDFKERNQRYLWSRRPKPSLEKRMKALTEAYKRECEENRTNEQDKPPYLSAPWFEYKYQTTKDDTYRMVPDDLESWEGLIAPDGSFYSCNFGCHNAKAWYLLNYYSDQFPPIPNWVNMTNALDFIQSCGWCATRSVNGNHYLLSKRPTKAQIHRILDAADRHQTLSSIDRNLLVNYL